MGCLFDEHDYEINKNTNNPINWGPLISVIIFIIIIVTIILSL